MKEANDTGIATRRKFITGAAVGAGTALMMTTGEAKAGTFTPVNVRDLGADNSGSPTSGAANTSIINNAISQAAGAVALYFPPGTYALNGRLVATNRDLVLFGDGPDISKIVQYGADQGIFFNGTTSNADLDQLIVRNLGLQAGHPACGNAIYASWTFGGTGSWGATMHSAIIENVIISIANNSSRFITGIYMHNAANSRVVNCELSGMNVSSGVRDAHGIVMDGQGADNHIIGCQFADHDIAAWVMGVLEGTRFTNCSFLGNYGIIANGDGSNPLGVNGMGWVTVQACHFDNYYQGIEAHSVINLQVSNCYFIKENFSANGSACIWIERNKSTAWAEDAIINHNIFRRNDNQGTTQYGILVTRAPGITGNVQGILIDGNRFCGGVPWTNTAYLDGWTTRIRYTDTNLTQFGESVANGGGSNNIIG